MKTIILLLVSCSIAHAESLTSQTDSLGYTHYNGKNITGLSHTDSLGYKHSDWTVGNRRIQCLENTDRTGFRRLSCH